MPTLNLINCSKPCLPVGKQYLHTRDLFMTVLLIILAWAVQKEAVLYMRLFCKMCSLYPENKHSFMFMGKGVFISWMTFFFLVISFIIIMLYQNAYSTKGCKIKNNDQTEINWRSCGEDKGVVFSGN